MTLAARKLGWICAKSASAAEHPYASATTTSATPGSAITVLASHLPAAGPDGPPERRARARDAHASNGPDRPVERHLVPQCVAVAPADVRCAANGNLAALPDASRRD